MNAPNPVPPTPTASTPIQGSTLGAILGGVAGTAAAGALHLNPLDPATGGAVIGIVSGLIGGLFHWISVKLKIPGFS